MTIDASIPLQVKQYQQPDRMNMMAQIMGIRQAQNQNELATYGLNKARRQDDQSNALMAALRDGLDISTPEGQTKALTIAPEAAQTFIKGRLENQNTLSQIEERKANAGKHGAETAEKIIAMHRNQLGGVRDAQTAAQWMQAQYQDPVVGPLLSRAMPLDAAIKSIPQDPAGLQSWVQQQALGMTKYLEMNKPHYMTQDNGQVSNIVAMPGLGGAPQTVSSVQRQATPGEVLSANTSTQNNVRSVGAANANADATRAVATATRDAARIQSDQNTEMKLGDDYRAQSKNFKETADAYRQITSVLDKATTSPAATLAGATKFMKMIDPGSVVRESELGMALAATGVFDRATNYFNTLQRGKVLTPSQVTDFKTITKQINDAASAQQRLIDKHFSDVARTYKLRPEMVVQDLGQGQSGQGTTPQADELLRQADAILRGGK